MNVEVTLSEDDLAFLDEYAEARRRSRSEAVHEAIAALRQRREGLAEAYAEAFGQCDVAGPWEIASADGLD